MQSMLTKVCEHQKIRPLDVSAIYNRVHLVKTPIEVLSLGISIV